MVALARKNAAKKGLKPSHVAFVQASLVEPLPIESESVDCILSNCVINLLPSEEKGKLFKEMHRVLKKGGRVVLDDVSIYPVFVQLRISSFHIGHREKTFAESHQGESHCLRSMPRRCSYRR